MYKCNKEQKKESIICSLYQIENFLCSFTTACKTFNFYKFLKNLK